VSSLPSPCSTSPPAICSDQSKQVCFLEDDSCLLKPEQCGVTDGPTITLLPTQSPPLLHSFSGFTAELEQNQPRYLYLKADTSLYYDLLIKDAELFTVDLSTESSRKSPRLEDHDHQSVTGASEATAVAMKIDGSESPRLPPVESKSAGQEEDLWMTSTTPTHMPPPHSIEHAPVPRRPASSSNHSSDDLNEIFSRHIQVLKYLQSSSWSLHEGDSQWAPNECAWYCRTCYSQFSLFQRKHHCRRCGEVFCDDHAPKVDFISCCPKQFRDVRFSLSLSHSSLSSLFSF
jgi:hypothetical protein